MTNEEAANAAIKILDSCIDPKIENTWLKDYVKKAIKKQIKMKPLADDKYFGNGICASCGAVFMDKTTPYCGNCGQKLDWEV